MTINSQRLANDEVAEHLHMINDWAKTLKAGPDKEKVTVALQNLAAAMQEKLDRGVRGERTQSTSGRPLTRVVDDKLSRDTRSA